MSVSQLFVEGKTEAQLINTIGTVSQLNFITVDKGSKDGLPNKVLTERILKRRTDIYMIRDRDFDFDVSCEVSRPQALAHAGQFVGWHWCRHEIENYLLEPSIVCKAIPKIQEEAYHRALITTANAIRCYVAARWTIGYAKRKTHLPPYYSLRTKPDISDLSLPNDLSASSVQLWMKTEAKQFRDKVDSVLSEQVLMEKYLDYEKQFSAEKCADVSWILHTFPGKNLFTGLSTWLIGYALHPGDLKGAVMNYIIRNPDEAVAWIPEWQELIKILKNPAPNINE